MRKWLPVIFALFTLPLAAQVSNPSIILVATAPSGACTAGLPNQQAASTGALYSCQNGTWGEIGGGGGMVYPGAGVAVSTGSAWTTSIDPATLMRSSTIIPISSLGCANQNADPMVGGGHDDTSCINAAITAAAGAPITLWWDKGFSLTSGLIAPTNVIFRGNGAGIVSINITNCGISSGTATFTTAAQNLTAGQWVDVEDLNGCSALNGSAPIQVLSAGLTTTQFEATVSAGDVAPATEAAKAVYLTGTGIFLAANSGDAISNGAVPSGGGCGHADSVAPARTSTNLGFFDFGINGNGLNQGANYCFGIDVNDATNVVVDRMVFYNIAHFSIKMANLGRVSVTQDNFYSSAAGTPPLTTDGVHIDGPANDISISDSQFHTGDDAIALNASEDYCGPITNVGISNIQLNHSRSVIRAYNNGVACANGLTPLISKVSLVNVNGTVYDSIANLGFDTIGTLNPAITDFSWANSHVNSTGNGIVVVNNIGRFSLDDFTASGSISCLLCSSVGSQSIARLDLHNVKLVGNSGASFGYPLGDVAGGGTLTAVDAIVDGLGEYNDAGGTISANCPFCGAGAVTNLYASNIDMNLFNTFADSHVTNLEGQAGGDIWAYPAGFVNGNTAIHMKNGLTFTPEVSAGGAHTYFEDTSGSHNVFLDLDNNNRTATITSGASGSPITPLAITSSSTDSTRLQMGNTTGHNYIFFVSGSSLLPTFSIYDLTSNKELMGTGESGTTPFVEAPTLGLMGFASGTVYNSTPDTAFSRDSAGVVDVGNGAQGDKSGTVNAARVNVNGGATTVYKCSGGTFDGLLATSSGACTGGSGTATGLHVD